MPPVGNVHLCRKWRKRSQDRRSVTSMSKKSSATSFALFVIILTSVFATVAVSVCAMPINVPVVSAKSAVHQVPDFSAQGVGDGYSLNVSPKGGYLSTGGSSITLTPWGYTTTQWAGEPLNTIFLANVTQNDFYIAFLYLTNSSSQIILRIFEYQGGSYNTITVEGSQRISNTLVNTASVIMPTPRLEVQAQTDNAFTLFGSDVYVDGNYGTLLNGSIPVKIAALKNQIFDGPTDYNELWSLLADSSGNYYFAILYLQNNDPYHVILEHQIRLNDYQTLPGRTLNAQWVQGHFMSSLTVRLPQPGSIVKVDGFPFQTDDNGILSVGAPGYWATVEVPGEISPANGTRLKFSSWDNYGTTNPLNVTLTLNSITQLTAEYNAQYLLTIDSNYPGVKGAGWYPDGANATFTVSPILSSQNGTRRVFLGFSGAYNSSSNTGSVLMNSPKHVSTNWKTQYDAQLQLSGVPTNCDGDSRCERESAGGKCVQGH